MSAAVDPRDPRSTPASSWRIKQGQGLDTQFEVLFFAAAVRRVVSDSLVFWLLSDRIDTLAFLNDIYLIF